MSQLTATARMAQDPALQARRKRKMLPKQGSDAFSQRALWISTSAYLLLEREEKLAGQTEDREWIRQSEGTTEACRRHWLHEARTSKDTKNQVTWLACRRDSCGGVPLLGSRMVAIILSR